ncbi:hypothetical protein [Mannheimia indoligenes]|uniref:hypothetical protein n=1 Tax=Mannheimia indoligenes TaxID=3103145 RepID=UPI002FE53B80
MRNQDRKDYLDLVNELDQHLLQVEAVINYLSVDLGENKEFTAGLDVVSGMLWTAQTLIENAKDTAERLHKHNRKAFLGCSDKEAK